MCFLSNFGAKMFEPRCENCILRVQSNTLVELFYSKNFFLDFEQNFFAIWVKTFRQGCQNCILSVQKNVLGYFFPNVNMFTPNWQITDKKIYILMEKFSFRNVVRRKISTQEDACYIQAGITIFSFVGFFSENQGIVNIQSAIKFW